MNSHDCGGVRAIWGGGGIPVSLYETLLHVKRLSSHLYWHPSAVEGKREKTSFPLQSLVAHCKLEAIKKKT